MISYSMRPITGVYAKDGKWRAQKETMATLGTMEVAERISLKAPQYNKETISLFFSLLKQVLCEMLAEGYDVRIDNLARFYTKVEGSFDEQELPTINNLAVKCTVLNQIESYLKLNTSLSKINYVQPVPYIQAILGKDETPFINSEYPILLIKGNDLNAFVAHHDQLTGIFLKNTIESSETEYSPNSYIVKTSAFLACVFDLGIFDGHAASPEWVVVIRAKWSESGDIREGISSMRIRTQFYLSLASQPEIWRTLETKNYRVFWIKSASYTGTFDANFHFQISYSPVSNGIVSQGSSVSLSIRSGSGIELAAMTVILSDLEQTGELVFDGVALENLTGNCTITQIILGYEFFDENHNPIVLGNVANSFYKNEIVDSLFLTL
jgi:hypothetical protein